MKVNMMTVMGLAMAVMNELNETLADGEVTVAEVLDLVAKAVDAGGLGDKVLYKAGE